MPTHEARDREVRRKQIMDGALRVFAGKGYEKATNRDIAREAGIRSPGLIYHYFKDKQTLFQEVLEANAPALQFLVHADEMMDRPPGEVLSAFGSLFLKTLTSPPGATGFRLMMGEAMRRPSVAGLFNQIGPGRAFRFLTRYLSHQMDLGVLRRCDTGVAARSFVGGLVVYAITREVFPQDDSSTLAPETMAAEHVKIFLRGLEAQDNDK